MGFPLPADPDVTALAYYLIAIPDAPEYRQAVKGWFGELGNAKNWGQEGIVPGSFIAAQAWLRAIDETWRLIEMAWPDTLLAYIDDLETLLAGIKTAQQNQLPCCGNYTAGNPPGGASSTDPVPQPIIDAGYATGTSDYAGYANYKCMAAHVFLDNLIAKLNDFACLSTIGDGGMAIIDTILAVVVGGGGAVVMVGGILIDIAAMAALWDAIKDFSSATLEGLAAGIEDNRAEIVCAIVSGDGINDTIDQFDLVIDSLFSDVNAFVIKMMNIRHMMQLFFYGEYGGVDIAAAFAAQGYDTANYNCTCAADVIVEFTFDAGAQGWAFVGGAGYYATWDCIRTNVGGNCGVNASGVNAAASVGQLVVGHTYRYRAVRFLEGHTPDNSPNPGITYSVSLAATGSGLNPTFVQEESTVNTNTDPDTLVTIDVSGRADFVLGAETQVILRMGNCGGNGYACFDNVVIELDDVT